jgi:predicted cobalt transporter CbtA
VIAFIAGLVAGVVVTGLAALAFVFWIFRKGVYNP